LQLNNLDVTQSQWEAKVKALKDLTHHLKKRRRAFGGAENFGDSRQKELTDLYLQKKQEALKDFLVKENGGRIAKRLTRGQRMSNMSYNIAHFIGELSVVGYGMLDILNLHSYCC